MSHDLKPEVGISLELSLAVVVSLAAADAPVSLKYYPLVLLLFQFLLTFLLHCPAHFIVGSALGIRFTGLYLGRTSLASGGPPGLRRVTSMLVVLTLRTDRDSVSRVNKKRRQAMYLSGVAASVSSAFIFALLSVSLGSATVTAVTFAFAFAYLAFNLVFSPKTGDIRRALSVSRPRGPPLEA